MSKWSLTTFAKDEGGVEAEAHCLREREANTYPAAYRRFDACSSFAPTFKQSVGIEDPSDMTSSPRLKSLLNLESSIVRLRKYSKPKKFSGASNLISGYSFTLIVNGL